MKRRLSNRFPRAFIMWFNLKLRKRIKQTVYFDTDWYLNQYPDVADAKLSPLGHYIRFGEKQGYNPNPFFNAHWYLDQVPDVADANLRPLDHYMRFGCSAGRKAGPLEEMKSLDNPSTVLNCVTLPFEYRNKPFPNVPIHK